MNLFQWIIVPLVTVNTNNLIGFSDLKNIIESSEDYEESTTCPICLEPLFNFSSKTDSTELKSKILKEAEEDVISFVERNSLIFCSSSQKHIIHKFCFIKSYEKGKVCPLCKSEINEDLFEQCVLEFWLKFYDLKDDQKNFLISQLCSTKIEILIQVLKIFKFSLGENKLENLKNLISSDDSWLLRIIDLYEYEKDNEDLVFLSKILLELTETEIRRIFTPEKVSNLSPQRMLSVLKNLFAYEIFEIADEPILNEIILCIENMNEYDEKFSVEVLFELISEELNSGIKCLFYFKIISTKMVPKDPLEKEKILKFILNILIKKCSCMVYATHALMAFPRFYRMDDREFFEKLICFALNQEEQDLEKDMLITCSYITKCLYRSDIQLYTDLIRSIIMNFDNIINATNESKHMEFIISSFAHCEDFKGEIGILLNSVMSNQKIGKPFIVNFKRKKIKNEEFVKKVDEIIDSLNKN